MADNNLYLYKIPASDTSLSEEVSNPAQVNVGQGGSVSGSITTGITEQQVRDIVGQNISTGLKEDQVRDIVSSSMGTVLREDQIRNIVSTAMRSTNVMTEEKVRAIVNSMQKFLQGQNIMMDGIQKSQNFYTGVSGWQIDAEGNAEFNSGTFRGTFNIGGTTITIGPTQDIQTYIDIIDAAGGGTLYLQNGTYTLTADLQIPSGVRVYGVSRDSVIIDCDGSYKVVVAGSNAYSTGTITIANGGTTVVGSGTTFTSGMVGRFIILGQDGDFFWYEITAFTDATHITIGEAYTGPDLSGDTYTIADIVRDVRIGTLTVQNATAAAVKFQYVMEATLDNINVYDSGTGLDFDQVVFPLLELSVIGCGVNADWNEVSGFEIRFSIFSDSTSGAGFVMNSCGNATFFDSGLTGNFDDGLNATNCSGITFLSMDVNSNGDEGIELVSNCYNNSFIAVNSINNASDGYKFTASADRNTIVSSAITGNGGYGVNIAAASCDNNQIIAPAFDNNASGNINDQGTNTFISPQEVEPFFQQNFATGEEASSLYTSSEYHFGTMTDGSAIFLRFQGNGVLYRLGKTSVGQFVKTHSVTPSLTTPAGDRATIVNIGIYIYLCTNDGTNIVISRFLAADLTGEQVMTVPTVPCTSAVVAWTDGTDLYITSSSSATTSRRWTLSGTTFTAASTASISSLVGFGQFVATMWDGTNAWLLDNNTYPPTLYKLTAINGSATSSTILNSLPLFGASAASTAGGFIIPINSTNMYVGRSYSIFDASAVVMYAHVIFPIMRP